MLNDEEARLLAGEVSLLKAGRQILGSGPRAVIIKKGEHGSFLVSPDQIFLVPGFPLEQVKDPTGAGDTFAGAFAGSLAQEGGLRGTPFRWRPHLRRAMVRGTVLASFTVEEFSFDRLRRLSEKEIEERVQRLREMVSFD